MVNGVRKSSGRVRMVGPGVAENHMRKTPDLSQPSPLLRLLIALYWALCTAVATHTGFFATVARPPSPPPPRHLVSAATVATLAPQPLYFAAVSTRGRRLSPPTVAAFAAANGLLETAVFDAVARVGAAAVDAACVGGAPAAARAGAAFAALAAYCGAIHALFWERAFPPHLPRQGTRQAACMRACLALFVPMTAAWCGLLCLDRGRGVRTVVALHVLADAAAGAALRLRPPW